MANSMQAQIDKDEKELEELLKAQAEAEGTPVEEPVEDPVEEEPVVEVVEPEEEPENAEERTFKERYANLRRHSQKREQELKDQIEALEAGQTTTPTAEVAIPESTAELETFRKENPEAATIIESLASSIAENKILALQEQIDFLTEDNKVTKMSKALAEIKASHPDFDDIKVDEDFHLWISEQPSWADEAIFEKDDPKSAIRVIDLYKGDMEKKAPKAKKKETPAAATEVRVKSQRPAVKQKPENKVSESWVASLDDSQFVENEEKIRKAQAEGNFIYDISGGAR